MCARVGGYLRRRGENTNRKSESYLVGERVEELWNQQTGTQAIVSDPTKHCSQPKTNSAHVEQNMHSRVAGNQQSKQ